MKSRCSRGADDRLLSSASRPSGECSVFRPCLGVCDTGLRPVLVGQAILPAAGFQPALYELTARTAFLRFRTPLLTAPSSPASTAFSANSHTSLKTSSGVSVPSRRYQRDRNV